MAKPKGGLGRGLDALFIDNDTSTKDVSTLNIDEIEPNKTQPRKDFDEEALSELAASIKEHGVLQPLLVRPMENGRYQIVAGERRWRASRIAGLTTLPVVIRELTDIQTHEVALVENLIREDLNPIEEALGYKSLSEDYNLTQEEISKTVGKSRPAIANALRLLDLPKAVVELVSKGDLSAGHAKVLLSLKEKDAISLAKEAVAYGLSVREVEKRVKTFGKGESEKKPKPVAKTIYTEMQLALEQALSRKVKISPKGDGKGELTIEFYSDEELKNFGKLLTKN